MLVIRTTRRALLLCALLFVGCRGTPVDCPVATVTANPQEIPSGVNQTDLSVTVSNPFPANGLEVITDLAAVSGTITDPNALETTYVCAHDISGPVEICATATYLDPAAQSEDANVSAAYEYLRLPHVRIPDPLECSEERCTNVICPEEKNQCPIVSSLTVEPMDAREQGTATIEVVAEDPDDGPQTPLDTTITARHGSVDDEKASTTTYTCDSNFGGAIEICAVAHDGDSSCDDELCTWVLCPGESLENTCPIIQDFTADPNPIPAGEDTTTVRVDAVDPDDSPGPLETEFICDESKGCLGDFEDRNASETIFRCGKPGDVEISVEATDGDEECNQSRSIIVRCPSDILINLCPMLFVINSIPRIIPEGETTTRVETRGQDTDGLPLPLELTLNALWGSFENTTNIQEPNNVVAQNATYVCDRPGPVEVCVDATDGACLKTLCDNIVCPDDIPTPP